MKNAAIVRIISWSIVAIILIGVLVAGITGKLPFFFFNIGTSVHYENSSKYSIADGTINAGQVSNIEINWVDGGVHVEEYEGEDVIFAETSSRSLDEDSKMRYYIRDDKLTIQFCASRRALPSLHHLSKDLTLKVPYGHSLAKLDMESVSARVEVLGTSADKIEVESVSGSVRILDTTAHELDVEAVSGDLMIENAQTHKLSAESVSGSIQVQGDFNNVEFSTVSGSVAVTPGKDISFLDADTVSGDIEIKLPEDIDGFRVTYSALSGDLRCDFPGQTNKKTLTYQNGRADFNLETVSGKISIEQLPMAGVEI